jgi:hypothetical protein
MYGGIVTQLAARVFVHTGGYILHWRRLFFYFFVNRVIKTPYKGIRRKRSVEQEEERAHNETNNNNNNNNHHHYQHNNKRPERGIDGN